MTKLTLYNGIPVSIPDEPPFSVCPQITMTQNKTKLNINITIINRYLEVESQ